MQRVAHAGTKANGEDRDVDGVVKCDAAAHWARRGDANVGGRVQQDWSILREPNQRADPGGRRGEVHGAKTAFWIGPKKILAAQATGLMSKESATNCVIASMDSHYKRFCVYERQNASEIELAKIAPYVTVIEGMVHDDLIDF